MKALPIRWKFALWAATLAGFVVLIFAGGTFLNLYNEQLKTVEAELEAESRHIASLSEQQLREKNMDELAGFQPWLALAVFDGEGNLLRRSSTLPEEAAIAALRANEMETIRGRGGESWRFKTSPHGSVTVVLTHTLSDLHELVHDLLFAYGVLVPVVLILAASGGWWVAGRALAPLRALADAAESIRADHLDRRVPALGAQDEIRRLADVLNAMLGRLQEGLQQAQRFAADASHELRTPLTIMQGEIERLLRAQDLNRTHEEKLLSLQEEIGRLDRITEHLLLLARFDSGYAAIARQPVDLSTLVTAACEDAELLADARDVELSSTVRPGVVVCGDQAHLRRLVLSLLDNATRYNYAEGKVHCVLDVKDDEAELRVRNTGPGIPAPARGQLFQRFFRVDPARTRGGHGLGLSLTQEIARAHGGRIRLEPDSGDEWTEFTVTIPLAPSRLLPVAVS